MQNGTVEEVKKIVTTLSKAEVPSEDVVGMYMILSFKKFEKEKEEFSYGDSFIAYEVVILK